MRPFRFLHTADLHLGTPFQGIGGHIPDHWVNRLRTAAFEVFARIVDVAIQEQVQFVTIAGDLFDAEQVPMAVQFELMRGFTRLAEHGILVYACHGNHDPLRHPSPLRWPDNVHIFPAVPPVLPDDYIVPSAWYIPDDETRVQIAGFSYGSQEMTVSMAEGFHRLPTATFAIGLYHGVVGSSREHANYCATTLGALNARGFDFWGLGHIHQPADLQSGKPVVLYPGNPQGRHARENGERGIVIADVGSSGEVHVRRMRTATVEWNHVTVDLDGLHHGDEVQSAVLDSLKFVRKSDGTPAIVRLRLTGQTAMHASLMDAEEWLAALQDQLSHERAAILLERLEIATTPPVDVDALRHSDAFVGTFLRQVEDARSNLQEAKTVLLPLLQDVFHAGNSLSAEGLSDEDITAMLDEAVRLVLTELTVEAART